MTQLLINTIRDTTNVDVEEFEAVIGELQYATKWGTDFDDKNTLNDWVTYVCMYASDAAKMGEEDPYSKLIKAAGLALTAATRIRNKTTAPRHYD